MTTLTAQFDVPIGADSPGTCRRAVLAVLAVWGYQHDDWVADASVVVSELVTNAVQHGAGSVQISLEAYGPHVIFSVADGSSVVPRRREPDGRGGRGLVLVEALTRRWHVEEHEGGKRVRAEMRLYPDADGPPAPPGSAREDPLEV
ncbi:ATP-binding protein [Actinoplanes philippinensis]|uniref:ATP-binding protein n=1 Tax=Actinoplanes philippinensis TaxID=35752 RepID=UPI00340DBA2B